MRNIQYISFKIEIARIIRINQNKNAKNQKKILFFTKLLTTNLRRDDSLNHHIKCTKSKAIVKVNALIIIFDADGELSSSKLH